MAKHVADKVAQHEKNEEKAAAELAQHNRECEAIFESLDVDQQGTIGLDEFLLLKDLDGVSLSEAELRAIFAEKDADRSGSLDLDEFKILITECPHFLELKDAIAARAKREQGEREQQRVGKSFMLTLGLPKRPKAEGSPNTMAARLATKRPSLAGVSNVDLNVRRLIKEREETKSSMLSAAPA